MLEKQNSSRRGGRGGVGGGMNLMDMFNVNPNLIYPFKNG